MRGPTPPEGWLAVKEISRHFGGILALNRVSFQLEQGGITSLIGPNGAGKTTLINVITGLYPADQGRIHFQGENIAGLAAHSIAARGIGRTFQLEELFGSLPFWKMSWWAAMCAAAPAWFPAAWPCLRPGERRTRNGRPPWPTCG
ncbi:MAG: ATP-binding cassette domain-containing protein [Desulfobacteraceae bacterium]|nr:MAG: ATP-binding cassette domain-containing protein [Desulfobacteraceae bacterium]